MALLRVKRNGASHLDFLMNLEEQFRLVEYDEMTGPAFLTHLFLEQSDQTMAKIAIEILSTKSEGSIDSLRSQMKDTEASLW